MPFPLRPALLAGLMALAVPAAWAQTPPPAPAGTTVIAVVNGDKILWGEVVEEHQGLPAQYQSLPIERIYPVLVNRLIGNRLLLAEGNRQKLGEEAEVKRQVDRFRDRAVQEAVLKRMVAKAVTEDALKDLYKKYLAENPPKEEIRARHILVESEKEGVEIVAQLKGGADFATLAKAKSKDPAAQGGGDLDYFGREDMVPEFSEAAFKLKVGEFTAAPVKSPFGWHVIKVEDRRSSNPVGFEDAREDLLTQLSQHTITQYLEQLKAEAKIERFGPDGKPLPAEGEKRPAEGEKKPAEGDKKPN